MTQVLLTISAFASATRLSVKALRLYDELGLLPPARVDLSSGYRFYSSAQFGDARLIARLRQLGLPLSDIRTVLDAPPARRAEEVRTHWARVQAEHARREELARYVLATLQGDSLMTAYTVQTRFVPSQPVATLTRRVTADELPQTIAAGMSELHRQLAAQEAAPSGAPFVIFHGQVDADSDGPVEICQPYTGTLVPAGALTLREEPAHHEAFTQLTKAQFEFPGILSAYDATAAYAQKHGQTGPLRCREVYPYDWDSLGADEVAGEVAWPYTPA
ncbi:MAG: helix-turn-helix domain-containing protein [Deinococcus sp.]|uniref:MerR family transcriptional regulator n=1 Tax=Deinococcus sp. TaxID=47478 RepID=UPI0026DD8B1D|nr:helix-turn-helix domain-containing protein [Deinococcus sp.]MDO4247293.1 helix-turn-helix domain-containing protein [Deinococcus sp.]